MIRQLMSLLLLCVALSLALGYALMPTARLAVELAQSFGEQQMMAYAATGAVKAYLALIAHKALSLLPWLSTGVVAAILARAGLWLWVKPAATPERMTLEDEAGGTVTMYASPLSHDPGIRFFDKHPDEPTLESATEFENELFQLISSHTGIPSFADPNGCSSTLLADHIRSAYKHVVKSYAPGTVAANIVVAYQSGKILAYSPTKAGYRAMSDKFAQLSLVVVRRVRSFYRLPEAHRVELMRCLQVLASNNVPVDLSDEMRDVIRAVRIADMAGTDTNADGSEGAKNDAGVIDVRAIASLVSTSIVPAFKAFNVNQMLNKSDALDAIFVKKDGVLLVPPKQMRDAFAQLLPPDVSKTLALDTPAPSRHPSDQIIRQVLEGANVLVTVYKQVSCTSGVYAVRSGKWRKPSMWALSTKNLKQEIIDSWADWQFEVEIIAPGEIHVG